MGLCELTVDAEPDGVNDGVEPGHGGEALELGAVIGRPRPVVGRPSPAGHRYDAQSSTAAAP